MIDHTSPRIDSIVTIGSGDNLMPADIYAGSYSSLHRYTLHAEVYGALESSINVWGPNKAFVKYISQSLKKRYDVISIPKDLPVRDARIGLPFKMRDDNVIIDVIKAVNAATYIISVDDKIGGI